MLSLLRVLTIVIICTMAYLSINLIKYRECRMQLLDLSLARANLIISLPYWCSFIGFLYLIVLCSSFCCWCTSLSMVSVHHMFLIYSRSSHHQDLYVLALWTILCNPCQRKRPMGTERFLCAHLSCGTVFPFQFVDLAPYLLLKRTLRLFYFQNLLLVILFCLIEFYLCALGYFIIL